MAHTMPGRLRTFLLEHLPHHRVTHIMHTLEPFLHMTEQDTFVYSADLDAIDPRLPICVEVLTGIICTDIACAQIDDGLLPMFIGDGMSDVLITHVTKNPVDQLTHQIREDLTFALLQSFLKDLCATTNKSTDLGRFRRPSNDLWWMIQAWIASELINDPLHIHERHALEQLVVQASKGWIPLGVRKNPNTNVLILSGGRACHIPLPFAP